MPAALERSDSLASLPMTLSTTTVNTTSIPNMRKASNMPVPAVLPVHTSSWQDTNGMNSVVSLAPTVTTLGGGKTSMVIEKLTADLDRFRRELRAERAAKEDAQQELHALKGRIAKLEEQNSNLSAQCAANDSALARKERRLDEFRQKVEQEENRRRMAEQQTQVMSRELEDTVSSTQREISEAHVREKYAEGAYNTIRSEYSTLELRIKVLRKEVVQYQKRLDEQRREHQGQLMSLEVLLDQQRQEQESSAKHVKEMAKTLIAYRQTETNVQKLEKELQDTVLEMRWVMRLHQARGEEQVDSNKQPPPT